MSEPKTPQPDRRFAMVPVSMMRNPAWKGLSGADLKVLLAILAHADRRGIAFPSEPRLAELAQVTERTLQKSKTKLELFGFVRWDKKSCGGRSKTCIYTIQNPERTDGVTDEETPAKQVSNPVESDGVMNQETPSKRTRNPVQTGQETPSNRTGEQRKEQNNNNGRGGKRHRANRIRRDRWLASHHESDEPEDAGAKQRRAMVLTNREAAEQLTAEALDRIRAELREDAEVPEFRRARAARQDWLDLPDAVELVLGRSGPGDYRADAERAMEGRS